MKCQLFFQSLSLKRNRSLKLHSSSSDLNYEMQEPLWHNSVFYLAHNNILRDILLRASSGTNIFRAHCTLLSHEYSQNLFKAVSSVRESKICKSLGLLLWSVKETVLLFEASCLVGQVPVQPCVVRYSLCINLHLFLTIPAVLSRFKQQPRLSCFEDWPSTSRRGEADLVPIWLSTKLIVKILLELQGMLKCQCKVAF